MTKVVNTHEAKTHLSRLLDEVAAGRAITIAKNGKPIADLTPHVAKQKVKLGAWKNNHDVMIPDDFDDPDPEIAELFENSRIFPVEM